MARWPGSQPSRRRAQEARPLDTEGRRALVAWQFEHGEIGHKAERAAFGAALGLFARDHISRDTFATLLRPMDEALPWLLPKEPPHPYPPR